MPAPLPKSIRERVLTAYHNNEGTVAELAKRFVVGTASIDRWLKLFRTTNSCDPLPMGGAHRPYLVQGEGEKAICTLLDTVPESTLLDACEVHEKVTGIKVSQQTMSDTVRRLGYTKKKRSFVRSRRSSENM